MKAYMDGGGCLVKVVNNRKIKTGCPHHFMYCVEKCPHLDTSEKSFIRLTCGGTDVVFDRITNSKSSSSPDGENGNGGI